MPANIGRQRRAGARAACTLVALAMAGCVRFASFDEYRMIRQDELIAVRAAGNDQIQEVRSKRGDVFQAIPVVLSLESSVDWFQLADQVRADAPGTPFGGSSRRFYLLGSDTVRYTETTIDSGGVYLLPAVESDRFAEADLHWRLEKAIADGLAYFANDTTAPSNVRDAARAKLFTVTVAVDDYEKTHKWTLNGSNFYLLGVDAISQTDPAERDPAKRTTITPASHFAAAWSPGRVPLPVRMGSLPGQFVEIPGGFGTNKIDSVRILGHWYSAASPTAWRVRPIRRLRIDTTGADPVARLDAFRDLLTSDTARQRLPGIEGRFLQSLDIIRDAADRRPPFGTKRLLLVCQDTANARTGCFRTGHGYTLSARVPSRSIPGEWTSMDYDFRVQRRSWPVSAAVGTGLILVFLGLSTYR